MITDFLTTGKIKGWSRPREIMTDDLKRWHQWRCLSFSFLSVADPEFIFPLSNQHEKFCSLKPPPQRNRKTKNVVHPKEKKRGGGCGERIVRGRQTPPGSASWWHGEMSLKEMIENIREQDKWISMDAYVSWQGTSWGYFFPYDTTLFSAFLTLKWSNTLSNSC